MKKSSECLITILCVIALILAGCAKKDDDGDKGKETNTALEQQSTQNDTLAGSLTKLGNAWESWLTGSSGTAAGREPHPGAQSGRESTLG